MVVVPVYTHRASWGSGIWGYPGGLIGTVQVSRGPGKLGARGRWDG